MEPKENTSELTLFYKYRNKKSMHKNIYLRKVVLLENKYNMDLFYNPDLVGDIKKVKGTLRIQINGREMYANQKANIPG